MLGKIACETGGEGYNEVVTGIKNAGKNANLQQIPENRA